VSGSNAIYLATIWVIPAVIAITFHEAAHGLVAYLLGDQTAWRLGRVSFNPVKHIDPFGTILLPGLLLLTRSPFLFRQFPRASPSAAGCGAGRSGRPGHQYRTGVSRSGRVSCPGLSPQHRRAMGGGIDVRLPGVKWAAVKTCPVYGGTVKNYDFEQIRNEPSVISAVEVPIPDPSLIRDRVFSGGVTVIAESWYQAKTALDKMPIEWDVPAAHAALTPPSAPGSIPFRSASRANCASCASTLRMKKGSGWSIRCR
jgi:hypothetical protein